MQKYFEVIEDPRHQGYVKHKLSDILTIVMCGVLCGLNELSKIVAFAENKASFFKKEFGIEQIPSKSTISRVLSVIDGNKVSEIIISIMKEKMNQTEEVIAVDGKSIRSTSLPGQPHSALQIITAYLTESGIVLGQEKINKKTNEIPVFQQMLSYLNIENKTVTADSMHCQKETCKKIIEKHGNYVLGLKGNQSQFYEDIALYFESENTNKNLETHVAIEKNKGRVEKRICKKLSDLSWLDDKSEWCGLKTVFSVKRVITDSHKTSEETCYYISSLNASPERLLFLVREHWKIESMHWMLDVVFAEDFCSFENDNAHITLNIFRKYALLLHKRFLANSNKKISVGSNTFNCLLNDSLLLRLISSF